MLTRIGADVLVAQVELDLLVGALDDEGRVGVHDRSQALEGEAGGDADHQLLADADVEHALVARQLGGADLGEDDRGARIVVERARRELVEALAHRWSSLAPPRRPRAAARRSPSARARARRGRGRRRVPRSSPRARSAPRCRRASGRSRSRLSTTTTVRRPSPQPAGELHGLPVAALVELGVAHEAEDARARLLARASSAEGHAHRDRQAVAERAARDLHAGDQRAVGVVAERRVEGRRSRPGGRRRRSPWPPGPRSTRPGRGPWRAGSGRARDRRARAGRRAGRGRRGPRARRASRARCGRASRRR